MRRQETIHDFRLKARLCGPLHFCSRFKTGAFAHKFSASVVKENSAIACETLDLKGISKTKLAKSVHNAAHRETFRQIEYKARWRNRNFVSVDRWFSSSQLCSDCGHRHRKLSLSDRFWNCPNCGARPDRDHNAAKNVRDEGIRILLAAGYNESLNACGASIPPLLAMGASNVSPGAWASDARKERCLLV